MIKKLLTRTTLLLGLCFLTFFSQAQTSSLYGFSQSSGTYTPITGTTSTATGDDGTQNGISIGFNFDFAGTTYTTFSVSTNSFIRLGSNVTTGVPNYTNNLATTTNAPILAPFWDDNNATGGNIRYQTTGTTGSQILTVQWTNIHIGDGGSSTTPTYSFQIKLYEGTNIIEFIYGSASAAFVNTTASIGISSATGNYLSVTPGTPPTVSSSSANNSISSAVPANTIYTLTPPPPCAGTPAPGNTISSVAAACSGTNFMLSLQNTSMGTDISYQWQSSPDGITWTNVGTNSSTFTTAQTSTTHYQAIVTCANSTQSATSTPVMITINPYYNCFCTPVSNCVNEGIDSVAFDNFSNTSNFCVNSNGYTDYSNLGSVATITQGMILPIAVKAHINSSPASAGVWIDYDHNGTFDASEFTSLGSVSTTIPSGGTKHIFTGNIQVSPTAQTGITRMRVRSANQGGITATSSCITSSAFGEFEDYLITINAMSACTGTPTAGTISGTNSICANDPFTLTLIGTTVGTGIDIEWESSPAGAGFWMPVTGASTAVYTVTTGIPMATDFRAVVTCVNGGGFDVSNTFSVSLNSIIQCYCIPTYTNGGTNDVISNVTLGTLVNTSPSSGNPSPHYTDYTTQQPTPLQIPDLAQGQTHNLMVSFGSDGTQYSAVWVDFDQSGTFDTSEYFVGTPLNPGASGTTTIPILVPLGAQLGNTRMRIRGADDSPIAKTQACGASSSTYGEAEDYLVNVIVAPNCLPPTNFTLGTVTGTTVDLSWQANGPASQWRIEYGPTGFTIGTGMLATVTSTNTTIPNLMPNTAYTAFIRSVCGTSDSSINEGPVSFVTTQIPVTVFPWVENWETGGTNWSFVNGTQANTWHVGTATSSSGTNAVYISNDAGATNGYNINSSSRVYIYRDITFPASSPAIDLSFDWKAFAEACCDYMRVWMIPTTYVPVAGTAIPNNIGALQIGANMNQQQNFSRANFTIPASYAGTTSRLVFEWYNDGSLGTHPPAALDSVRIIVGICHTPATPSMSSITQTTAELTWTEVGNATQWSIEYGPTGFTPGNGTFISTSTNPYTLTNLAANTQYDFRVKSICSASDSSVASQSVSFTTRQIPQSVFPYAQNFNTGATDWTIQNGNQINKWYVGVPGSHTGNGGLYISDDEGMSNNYNNVASSAVHAYRDLDLTSFSAAVPVTFNAYVTGESCCDYISIWMVPVSYQPTPGTQITAANSGGTQIGSNINGHSGWTPYNISIPISATGGLVRMIIEWRNDGSAGSAPVKLDELTIGGFPLAIKLANINATNVGRSNRITWKTASEESTDVFELERSFDGRNFDKLATIKAQGKSSDYTYWDETPVNGVNYYRLKMISASGEHNYSGVVQAIVKENTGFNITAHPNPVKNLLTVIAKGGSTGKATLSVTDITGKTIQSVIMHNGFAEIDMSGLANGFYLIKYADGSNHQTIKITKQ